MMLEAPATRSISWSGFTTQGTSDTARFVYDQVSLGRRRLDESFTLGLQSRGVYEALCSIYEECQQPGWDGYGAEPISGKTYRFASRFLESLPPGTPPPSVGAEADGHLTFEWYRTPNRLLSVSVSPEGMLYYAALLGPRRRSGTEPVQGAVPHDLTRIIHLIFTA